MHFTLVPIIFQVIIRCLYKLHEINNAYNRSINIGS